MTAFARLRPVDSTDPGARLRVEFPADDSTDMAAVVADERVLPERVHRTDAVHVESLGALWLYRADVEWLRDTLTELLEVMP